MSKKEKRSLKRKERAKKSKQKVLKRREQLVHEKEQQTIEEAEFEKLEEAKPKPQTIRYDANNPRPMSHKKRQKILKKIEANNKLLEFLEKAALDEAKDNGENISDKLKHEEFIKVLKDASKNVEPLKLIRGELQHGL